MVGDNGEPMPDVWQVEPRANPFDPIFESPIHLVWMRGCDVALADAEVDALGCE